MKHLIALTLFIIGITCTSKPTCLSGLCCDLKKHEVREMNYICALGNECQQEKTYCDGTTPMCPTPAAKKDGTKCSAGVCKGGKCVRGSNYVIKGDPIKVNRSNVKTMDILNSKIAKQEHDNIIKSNGDPDKTFLPYPENGYARASASLSESGATSQDNVLDHVNSNPLLQNKYSTADTGALEQKLDEIATNNKTLTEAKQNAEKNLSESRKKVSELESKYKFLTNVATNKAKEAQRLSVLAIKNPNHTEFAESAKSASEEASAASQDVNLAKEKLEKARAEVNENSNVYHSLSSSLLDPSSVLPAPTAAPDSTSVYIPVPEQIPTLGDLNKSSANNDDSAKNSASISNQTPDQPVSTSQKQKKSSS